jgi:HD-GYP domain-containing protein (c-di-GMP phosphodiesterase class II)
MPFANQPTITDAAAACDTIDMSRAAKAWATFTELVHDLDACQSGTGQIEATLDALRATLGKGIVYWFNEASGELIGPGAPAPLSAEGCRSFAQKMVTRKSGKKGAVLWTNPQAADAKTSHVPLSAAALRVHRSRPGWILAVSFDKSRPVDSQDVRVIGLAAALLQKQTQHSRAYLRIKASLTGFVHCLAAVVDARDSCTAGHSERVSRIAATLGRKMQLPSQTLSDLQIAGILHDVGKISIRDEVLLKAGKLTAQEYRHMQEHVVLGDQIVSTIKEFSRLRLGVRHHHERFDGKGYPDGLAGEGIPLLGRILAVADACDAMMSSRRYRGPMPLPQIDAVLFAGAGTQWDAGVIAHFMECRQEIYSGIYQRGVGDSAANAIGEIMQGLKDASSATYPPVESESPADPLDTFNEVY